MPLVNSRQSLKEYCLRKLGSPVMQINVDDDQVEDRIDDALGMFFEYHMDAMVKKFVAVQLTATDIANKKIPVPEMTYSVIKVFPISSATTNMNISFIAAMSDIMDGLRISAGKTAGTFRYFLVEQHLSLLQQFFTREHAIRFNRHHGFIEIDMNWDNVVVGDFVIAETWRAIDMDTYDTVWSDWWLESYTTACIKQQWGMNMMKYDGFQLPSGITLNGRQIFDDATQEMKDLEERLRNEFSYPVDFFVG